jgi:hypothetical protein
LPQNELSTVRALAAEEGSCEFFAPVLESLRAFGLDSDDLREIIVSELGEAHWFKSKKTEKHYPETFSDYYSLWIDDCLAVMFIKLLVSQRPDGSEKLVITSFKRNDRYV